MDNLEQEKLNFATKLTLPKFMAIAQSLTPNQKKLVRSMGFEHLLDLSCDSLPRGLVLWLVQNFDVNSRSLLLPNGFKFAVTPFCIHQVLGIPLGGRKIEKKYNESIKFLIAVQTKCKGNFPTINELYDFITPQLEGDLFKRVFILFALATFLCPSSHAAASPSYYHAIEVVEEIGSFDWCTTVLDKLVASIYKFKSGGSIVLGGNQLTLLIIYYELLDTGVVSNTVTLPRLSLWTSKIVREYEKMDSTSNDGLHYGRLPVKDVLKTPFSMSNSGSANILSAVKHDELLQFILSIVPKENHQLVKDELPRIMDNLYEDIVASVQPAVTKHIVEMLKLVSVMQPSADLINGKPPTVSASLPGTSDCATINTMDISALEASNIKSPNTTQAKSCSAILEQSDKDKDVELNHVTTHQPEDHSLFQKKLSLMTAQELEVFLRSFLVFPEITNEAMDTFVDGSTNIPGIESLTVMVEPLDISDGLDLPDCANLYDQMYPQKIDSHNSSAASSELFDLELYMSRDAMDHKRSEIMEEKEIGASKKLDFLLDYKGPDSEIHTPNYSPKGLSQLACPRFMDSNVNSNKRSTCMSLNELSNSCIALKKRVKMFKDMPTSVNNVDKKEMAVPVAQVIADDFSDYPWDDIHLAKEVFASADRLAEEYYSAKESQDDTTPRQQKFQVTEISPDNCCCTFTSSPVEKDVFNDIVTRIPFGGRSPRIIKIGSNWVDHLTFGLGMRVYGRINKHVMNMMGKAVIVEFMEKEKWNLLPDGHWSKYFIKCDIAALFQKTFENPADLYIHLTERMTDYRLDKFDMVLLPLSTFGFWYLIVANFRNKVFEVLCPNTKIELITNEAKATICNFKRAFRMALQRSEVNVFDMDTVFRSVSCSIKEADSGIFVMKLIQSHDGETILSFQPEDAKSLRESLTYYMVAHPCNENLMSETKLILSKYNIPYDYKTQGYSPWA